MNGECKHCGQVNQHYEWNCPIEAEKKRVATEIKINKMIVSLKPSTVKHIYWYMQDDNLERSTQDIADNFGVSANTARKWLDALLDSELVTVRKKFYGRGIYLLLWKARNKNDVR